MNVWRDEFADASLEEVLKCQAENRAWSKDIRNRTNALVNSRLAKLISQDDYLNHRKLVHEDAAECKRRADIIGREMQDLRDRSSRESANRQA